MEMMSKTSYTCWTKNLIMDYNINVGDQIRRASI